MLQRLCKVLRTKIRNTFLCFRTSFIKPTHNVLFQRSAQGWHDDDAAWEAFLDQAENNNLNEEQQNHMKHLFASSSAPPSMVCSISRSSPKEEVRS